MLDEDNAESQSEVPQENVAHAGLGQQTEAELADVADDVSEEPGALQASASGGADVADDVPEEPGALQASASGGADVADDVPEEPVPVDVRRLKQHGPMILMMLEGATHQLDAQPEQELDSIPIPTICLSL